MLIQTLHKKTKICIQLSPEPVLIHTKLLYFLELLKI